MRNKPVQQTRYIRSYTDEARMRARLNPKKAYCWGYVGGCGVGWATSHCKGKVIRCRDCGVVYCEVHEGHD